MTIMEYLKTEIGARIEHGNRWLVWDDTVWYVYERLPRKRHSSLLIVTDDEDLAVAYLNGRKS